MSNLIIEQPDAGEQASPHQLAGTRSALASSERRLGSQLTILVALSMFFMVLCVSVGTSYIINQSLTTSFITNGKNIAAVFAKESALAVLSGSPDGAEDAISIVRSFSGFANAAIYEADGSLLAQTGSDISWHNSDMLIRAKQSFESVLEYESDLFWQFASPIFLESAEPDLADLDALRSDATKIGMVRVLISKDELYSAKRRVCALWRGFLLLR